MNNKLIILMVLILLTGCVKQEKVCPTKPNPPCYSVDNSKEIASETIGVLTYESCDCPEGTIDTMERDSVSTPGVIYKICSCI